MTQAIPHILTNRKVLIGKEPVNGRLMIGIPVKGKLQTVAVGASNSVPGSVSRYNGEQGTAHLSLEIIKDGSLSVTNLKEQNIKEIKEIINNQGLEDLSGIKIDQILNILKSKK